MAYFIFLKSLRSLEEFTKNPHVKITPKSPSTNFQSLDKFKNLIFNSEIPFSLFLARPPPLFFSSPAAAHLLPPCLAQSAHRLLRLSDSAIASLSLTGGPTLSVSSGSSPSSDLARARPRRHRSLATERHPAPRLGCHQTVTTLPSLPPDPYHLTFIFPPLNPLLNPSLCSMVLKVLTPALNSPALPRPL
jgi:hypothetical protein